MALGRAIVRAPAAYLLDEPLSNLDAQLRAELRVEIKRLHHRLNTTMIYVTHDQIEAMTLADRIVLMRDGLIEQQGKPLDLFERPASNPMTVRRAGGSAISLAFAGLSLRNASFAAPPPM